MGVRVECVVNPDAVGTLRLLTNNLKRPSVLDLIDEFLLPNIIVIFCLVIQRSWQLWEGLEISITADIVLHAGLILRVLAVM